MTEIRHTFAVVDSTIDVGSYVTIGPAAALYRVEGVNHGPMLDDLPEEERNGTETMMLRMLGLANKVTFRTTLRLVPVDPHDVPWDATVHTVTPTAG